METSGKEKMDEMEMGQMAPREGVTPEKIAVGVLSCPAATLGPHLPTPRSSVMGLNPAGLTQDFSGQRVSPVC